MNKPSLLWLCGIAPLLTVPSVGLAMPSISGSNLTWPGGEWYQVQRTDTFETICEGSVAAESGVAGGPCVIDSSSYIVINHSTGERFENITAASSPTNASPVVVNGSTISWPDDGWYQVQNTSDYRSVCNGGTNCTVAPGTYVLINHSTGQRFEDIEVGGSVGGPVGGTGGSNVSPPTSVVVSGDTIRLPDDGWYQVQSADTFASLCEGETECQVSPGEYIVITPTTGERQVVDVTSGGTPDPDADPQPQELVRVDFNITVPAYVSNELVVRLTWSDTDLAAQWVIDETWSVSDSFPLNTDNRFVVTFYDRNGDIALGQLERIFRIASSPTQTIQISADDFDTQRWDEDGDGFSNLEELMAGTNPLDANTGGNTGGNTGTVAPTEIPQTVQARIELIPTKVLRLSWQPSERAEYYRILENPDGLSGYTELVSDLDASTQSHEHRVPLYLRVNAQYVVQACNRIGCVDSDELRVTGLLKNAIGYIKASNTQSEDVFGSRISLNEDASVMAIGVPGLTNQTAAIAANNNRPGTATSNHGSVYVFIKSGGIWQQQTIIRAESAEADDLFGSSVSLSADGTILAVGAQQEDSAARGINGNESDNSAQTSGAAYVFVQANDIWQQQTYFKASNADPGDRFGAEVTLSADGNTLAVGAISERSQARGANGNQHHNNIYGTGTGAVYMFHRSNGAWQQQGYLKYTNVTGYFGGSISLSGNGDIVVVGAWGAQSTHWFERVNGTWQDRPRLQNRFSSGAVSISNDGSTLAIAAETGNFDRTDVIHIYTLFNGAWELQETLRASNHDHDDNFGGAGLFGYAGSVSLSSDGNILAVGAFEEKSAGTGLTGDQNDDSLLNSGAAYVYTRSNGAWQQQAYIKAPVAKGFLFFGETVRLSGDGSTLAISATREDSGATGINGDIYDYSALRAGAVYLY